MPAAHLLHCWQGASSYELTPPAPSLSGALEPLLYLQQAWHHIPLVCLPGSGVETAWNTACTADCCMLVHLPNMSTSVLVLRSPAHHGPCSGMLQRMAGVPVTDYPGSTALCTCLLSALCRLLATVPHAQKAAIRWHLPARSLPTALCWASAAGFGGFLGAFCRATALTGASAAAGEAGIVMVVASDHSE